MFHYKSLQHIECNSLYSKSLLFIYFIYTSLYLLIPFSSFVPPSNTPLPFGKHNLFSICVSVLNKLIHVIF